MKSWLGMLTLLYALACVTASAQSYDDVSFVSEESPDTASSLRGQLESGEPSNPLQAQLKAFYTARDFKPVWSGSADAELRAAHVKETLEHADRQGLDSSIYMPGISQWNGPPEAGDEAAIYDIAMTTALLRYARDVRIGRVEPKSIYKDVELPQTEFDAAAALTDALKRHTIDKFLADLPPPHPAYRRLVEALARYRAIDALGGWPITKSEPKILVKRLAFEDAELTATAQPSESDLRTAVLRFQRRNGLNDDGKVGPEMLKSLNVSAAYRVKEIAANMERWRWVPRAFERRYVLVNVPDQSLIFVRNRSVVLRSRVVIGKKTSPTPLLRTEATAVVANPPWDIPDDIAAKQILPHLRKSPNYLLTRNMVLADAPEDPYGTNINWRQVAANNIPHQIQQNPGPDNVLGALMLDSPNDFDVYMHDTPNKSLFRMTSREMSNGCVRVDEIFPLASLALTNNAANGAEELMEAVSSGETQRVSLPTPLPIYMLYWTAMAKADGTMEFRPDRYGRDRKLIERLDQAGQ